MVFQPAGLQSHIWRNNTLSLALLGAFPLLLLGMLWAMGAGVAMLSTDAQGRPVDVAGMGNALVLAVGHWVMLGAAVWFVIAWLFHTSMIRAATGSHGVTRREEPKLYNMLENLCISRGLPMPKLAIMETDALNAFASGITNQSYTVTLTRGLIQTLPDDELEAVIAHELTHIRNGDVRLLIVSVIFVGMIGLLAQVAWRRMFYMGHLGSRLHMRQGGGNRNAGMYLLVGAVVLAVGYVFALLTRFALSRRREYLADAGAVELTRNPEAMIRALARISGRSAVPQVAGELREMFLDNPPDASPLRGGSAFSGLFATHPSIEQRIAIVAQTNRVELAGVLPTADTSPREKPGRPSPWGRAQAQGTRGPRGGGPWGR